MASKRQMTGMQGVYLTAAELTRRGLIVSITSRNARGADLLATDQSYENVWSIQVKTSAKPVSFWPLGQDYKTTVSKAHVYIFVNLRGEQKPDYYVVRSRQVAKLGKTTVRKNSTWHWFARKDAKLNDWAVFGV